MAYVDLGQNDKAVSAEQQAIRLNSRNWYAWLDLGAAYGSLGEFAKAVSAYKQALRLKPDIAMALYGLGLAYPRLGPAVGGHQGL